MPKTEPTVGNDDCAKWTTEAIIDKAQGSAESPACAESPSFGVRTLIPRELKTTAPGGRKIRYATSATR